MATCSSILAWEISWTEEPGGLPSMGSQGVRYDLATKQQFLKLLTRTIRILLPQAPAELMINTCKTCMCLTFPLECQICDLCVLRTAVPPHL